MDRAGANSGQGWRDLLFAQSRRRRARGCTSTSSRCYTSGRAANGWTGVRQTSGTTHTLAASIPSTCSGRTHRAAAGQRTARKNSCRSRRRRSCRRDCGNSVGCQDCGCRGCTHTIALARSGTAGARSKARCCRCANGDTSGNNTSGNTAEACRQRALPRQVGS